MAERLAADPAAQVAPLANCHKSLPRFLAGRPVFTLASRANASTRAVRNEEELLAHVRARYDVVVKVRGSHTPLLEAAAHGTHTAQLYNFELHVMVQVSGSHTSLLRTANNPKNVKMCIFYMTFDRPSEVYSLSKLENRQRA